MRRAWTPARRTGSSIIRGRHRCLIGTESITRARGVAAVRVTAGGRVDPDAFLAELLALIRADGPRDELTGRGCAHCDQIRRRDALQNASWHRGPSDPQCARTIMRRARTVIRRASRRTYRIHFKEAGTPDVFARDDGLNVQTPHQRLVRTSNPIGLSQPLTVPPSLGRLSAATPIDLAAGFVRLRSPSITPRVMTSVVRTCRISSDVIRTSGETFRGSDGSCRRWCRERTIAPRKSDSEPASGCGTHPGPT